MSRQILYMKCDAYVESDQEDVYLKDIASLQCADEHVLAKCKAIKVWHFKCGKKAGKKVLKKNSEMKNMQTRVVICCLNLVEKIEKICPEVQVEIVGETDVVLEHETQKKQGLLCWLKVVLVCLVCFFGTAFTIMAYHNDIGIRNVFADVYRIIMNREPKGINPLEVSYSIGLGSGILIFFNHVGNLKITDDPTPIEVSMKNYERDVNQALVDVAGRKGEEVEV